MKSNKWIHDHDNTNKRKRRRLTSAIAIGALVGGLIRLLWK